MELTVNIKEQNKIASFLDLLKTIDYIEIVDIKEETDTFLSEHRDLLDERLRKIENGETTFSD